MILSRLVQEIMIWAGPSGPLFAFHPLRITLTANPLEFQFPTGSLSKKWVSPPLAQQEIKRILFFDFFEQPFDFVKSVNLEILSKRGGADRAG